MAKCEYCNKEMQTGKSCSFKYLIDSDGKFYKRIKAGDDGDFAEGEEDCDCHDCAVKVGGYHHFGCDAERCPKCGMQLLGCECDWEELAINKK